MSEELENMVKMLDMCSLCLGTKQRWAPRKGFLAAADGGGYYDIFRCPQCCENGHWTNCSWRNDMIINGFPIFEVDNNDPYIRIKLVKPLTNAKMLKNKENELKMLEIKINEDIKQQNLKLIDELKQKNNELNTKKEHEKEELDKISHPLWLYYKNESTTNEVNSGDVELEIGKIANNIIDCLNAAGGNVIEIANIIKNFKLNAGMTMCKSEINKTEIEQIKDSNGNVTYLILKLKNKIIISNSFIVKCFTCNSKRVLLDIKYKIIKPKNKAAKDLCDEIVSRGIDNDMNN